MRQALGIPSEAAVPVQVPGPTGLLLGPWKAADRLNHQSNGWWAGGLVEVRSFRTVCVNCDIPMRCPPPVSWAARHFSSNRKTRALCVTF